MTPSIQDYGILNKHIPPNRKLYTVNILHISLHEESAKRFPMNELYGNSIHPQRCYNQLDCKPLPQCHFIKSDCTPTHNVNAFYWTTEHHCGQSETKFPPTLACNQSNSSVLKSLEYLRLQLYLLLSTDTGDSDTGAGFKTLLCQVSAVQLPVNKLLL